MKTIRYSIFYIFIASILTGFIGCSGKVKENKPEALLEEEVFDNDTLITIQLSGSKKYGHTFKFTDIIKCFLHMVLFVISLGFVVLPFNLNKVQERVHFYFWGNYTKSLLFDL